MCVSIHLSFIARRETVDVAKSPKTQNERARFETKPFIERLSKTSNTCKYGVLCLSHSFQKRYSLSLFFFFFGQDICATLKSCFMYIMIFFSESVSCCVLWHFSSDNNFFFPPTSAIFQHL